MRVGDAGLNRIRVSIDLIDRDSRSQPSLLSGGDHLADAELALTVPISPIAVVPLYGGPPEG
jgi:hypothetical protein